MRARDSQLFETMYNEEAFNSPDSSKYVCYLRTEARYQKLTGHRKYEKYSTFRVIISRRRRIRREQSNISKR